MAPRPLTNHDRRAPAGAVWTSRPRSSQHGPAVLLLAGVLLAALLMPTAGWPAEASTVTISGSAFRDLDRDGVRGADEAAFVDHLIYLYGAAGTVIATQRTDADGRYTFAVSPGTYRVAYAPSSWREIRREWVPTTTGTLFPDHPEVTAPGVADFGWRAITTSTDTPISAHRGPTGLTVQVYNDVLPASVLHDHIVAEFLVGDEAEHTTVRFARSSNMTNSVVYADHVRSTVNVTYTSWLDNGDRMLAHEYGHAWTNHHTHLTQQDPGWSAFLEARGLADDDRVGTSYAWTPSEIAAEDYRQSFASENARSGGQLNSDIPRPWEVEGFKEWLRTVYTQPPGSGTDPGDDGTEPEVPEDPDPEPGDPVAEEPEPAPTSPELSLEVRTAKLKGVAIATLTWTGAERVEVRADDRSVATVEGTTYTHVTGQRGNPTIGYQVCVEDRCAERVVVSSW